ncbi:hypothetical protein GYMLUDRAFT_179235 [Collybiopsis luxurians FD-317 M1]|uniref:Uncharacterized protein n=1 Tax=Collybiopsis luxurians FD-317 M1 TaxID=944289 RepID=A0A0D0C5V2_9AGAR|nr:hypothetical protein GYMLUDRAFT_179235 [Collybiopsis luxurians FD-317 M1]
MKIWYLPTSKLLHSPTAAGECGMTMAIVWIIRPDNTDNGLTIGMEDGYLCIWKRSCKDDKVFCDRLTGRQDGQEVSGIAYDASSGQLAPVAVKSVTMPKHWPQAVAFGQMGFRGPEIWSFRRDNNVIHVLNDNGKILKSRTTGSLRQMCTSRHAIINVKEDTIILNDVLQRVALYKLSTMDRLKTFAILCTQ